ncbi:MAG: hypothetical protein KDC14_06955, partial [Planctomycetes bacterium]|nr:hypothetical protein [Planctomycetota bacterium]
MMSTIPKLRRLTRALGVVLLFGAAFALPCTAQDARYELGVRLRGLEVDWDAATAEDKARALPELKAAVERFFRLQLGAAGRGLDRARFELTRSTSPAHLWSAQWTVRPERRFGDAREEAGAWLVSFGSLYESAEGAPDGAQARLSLRSANGAELARAEAAWPGNGRAWTAPLELGGVPEGDHRLVVEFGAESATWITRELGLSIATRATERVAAARIKLDAKIDAPALERATATRLLELLEPLLAGETLETDVPAARLLRELEGLGELAADRRSYVAFHPGEFLLRVPIGNRAVDVRLSSPPVAEGELRPCVVALHGAGGSDNLFFDGHGNGAAVRLASERGWLFVAPKAPFFGSVDVAGLLDALGERYAVDRSRVYLVGHSMGAAQAL